MTLNDLLRTEEEGDGRVETEEERMERLRRLAFEDEAPPPASS